MKLLGIIVAMLMTASAQAHDEKCPESKNHFAIVVEHVSGTNNSLYCKLVTGANFKNDGRTDSVECAKDTPELNSLVLITKGYYEAWDKIGNKRCMASTTIVEVVGKLNSF